ncbi:hypothetical protein LCGC14_1437610 [marine sediment metagenome]|uniref:Large polyvalent protein associated domain-containing protein n=1 Tax=marine sediment metagenome TaxID=412755 RepID=A0A0F9JLN0_9ZZZZ
MDFLKPKDSFLKPKVDFLKPSSTFLKPLGKPSLSQTLEQQIAEQERIAQVSRIPIPGKKEKLRIFDILEWARYPITNMLYTAAKEAKDDDLKFDDVGKILKSAVYGAMLKEKRNTEDVLKLLFPKLKPWQHTVFGVAGDIITDPLTWMTFGGAAAGKAGLRAAGASRQIAAKTIAKIGQKGAKVTAREGAESAVMKAFNAALMKKFGGRNVKEAMNLARRQIYLKGIKPGLNIRVPFTPFQKQIVKGSRVDILGNIAQKIGMPSTTVQAMKEMPTRLGALKPVRAFQKMFKPGASLGPFQDAHQISIMGPGGMGEKGLRAETVGRQFDDIARNIKDITDHPTPQVKTILGLKGKGANWKRDKIFDFMRDQLEQGKKLPDELAGANKKLRNLLDEQYDELVNRGLLKREQYIPDYFPRYFVNEDTGKIRVLVKPDLSVEGRYLNHRVFTSAEEAAAEGFKPRSTADSLKLYLSSVNKNISSHDTISEMVKRYGVQLKKGQKIKDLGPDYVKIRHAGFKDYVLPTEVGNTINKINLVLQEEDELRGLIKFANDMNNAWKKAATVYWPGFHGRNEASNMWTYAFKDGMGLNQLRNFRKAIKIFNNPYSDEMIKVFDPAMRRSTNKPIRLVYEMMRKNNIHTGGFYASEMGEAMRTPGILGKLAEKGGAFSPLFKAERAATKIGGKTGSFFENTARMASALSDLDKGLSIKETSRRVNLAFLNYQDITKVEQKLRKLVPFWTWFRGNLSNQLRYIVEDPGKYSMFTVKPLRAVNWMKEETKEFMPEWAKQKQYIQPFGMKYKGVPLMLNPNLPFQDIGDIKPTQPVRSIARMMGERLSPFIKTPAELALNKSHFTGKPIAYTKYGTEKAPTAIEPIIAAFPEQIQRKLGIVQTERGWEMPAKWTYLLMSIIPQMKLGQPIEYLARKGTPVYRKTAAPFDIGSRTMGVKFKPMDIEYYKQRALQERLRDLKEQTRKYGS